MLTTVAALALGLLAGDCVAVMASDPGGRGDELARAAAARLRADGWDAIVVPAPSGRIDSPAEQDRLAKKVGATRVLALDLLAKRQRGVSRGGIWEPYAPTLRVWRFDLRALGQPMALEPVVHPGPELPPAATHTPRIVQEEVRTDTRILWRRGGRASFDADRRVGAGAMTGWREDVAAIESRQALEHEKRLYEKLFAEIAGEAAETIEMK